MITDVVVEDYQAIQAASLKLGRFTVVTGPTGSGKSAVIRAIRLAAFNARGTAFIRHGAKQCQVALGLRDENLVVAILRGGRGKDAYRLTWQEDGPDWADNTSGVQFTKLGGEVPEEVSRELRLGEVNFAAQFDRPYLLTESGGQVARVLGELTNVTLVFDAAREANRRKLETARDLKQTESRLADLKQQARGFAGLKDRMAAVAEARDRLDSADFIRDRGGLLRERFDHWRSSCQLRETARQRLAEAEPPSTEALDVIMARRARLHELVSLREAAREREDDASQGVQHWHFQIGEAEDALHDALAAAGTCPTCGQAVGEA